MIVSHVKPESWVDTGEAGKIQPSEVAGLAHVVSLEPEDIELLRGPAGADGAPGPQGPAGADGAQGPQGPAGPAGADGAQGSQGPAGPAGADGAQGPQGQAGPAGADGAQGPQGPAGPAGADGVQGPQGPAGPAGADGAQGPQGPAGPVGEEFSNPKSSRVAIGLGLPAWDATISRLVISGHTGVFVSAHDYWGGVQVFSQSYPGLEGSFRTMSIKGAGVSMRVTPSGGDLRPGEVTIARDSDSLVFAAMGLDGVVKRAVLALT